MKEIIEKWLKEKLPQGSGFSLREIELKKDHVVAYMDYHVMNDTGCYVGYVDFSIRIPYAYPEDFRLVIHGKRSLYLANKYCLREFLEDTIALSLEED